MFVSTGVDGSATPEGRKRTCAGRGSAGSRLVDGCCAESYRWPSRFIKVGYSLPLCRFPQPQHLGSGVMAELNIEIRG